MEWGRLRRPWWAGYAGHRNERDVGLCGMGTQPHSGNDEGSVALQGMMKAALPWPLRDLGGIVANTRKMRYNAPQIDSIIFFAT